ncbi:hypothetical protein [Krasilnikoviella flava]|nr:hypothetical protein [Krasilnikoviella flava]
MLTEFRNLVVGEVVEAVRYVVPRGESWPEGHKEDRVHEVDMAIELYMKSGAVLMLSWAMDGMSEGMAIEIKGPKDDPDSLPGDSVDVTIHVDWIRYLGLSIANIGVSWHIPNEGCPAMPWAYDFDFSDGSSLVVALGEFNNAMPKYLPDALLVFFDVVAATEYKIPANVASPCD